MTVRDYWISKLPEVRKQSSVTGKLVEKLLINDSKVSRNILLEMAKLNENEVSDKEEINQLTEYIKKDIQKVFSQASQQKPGKEVFKQIVTSVKGIEKKYKNKNGSKLYLTETVHTFKQDADGVFRSEEDLFKEAGFEKEYNAIKGLFVVGVVGSIIALAVAIYFGVLIYRYYRDKSKKIQGIILGVIAGILAYQIAGMAIGLVLGSIYMLIKYLISLFRK